MIKHLCLTQIHDDYLITKHFFLPRVFALSSEISKFIQTFLSEKVLQRFVRVWYNLWTRWSTSADTDVAKVMCLDENVTVTN